MTDAEEYRDKRWIALALLCMAQFIVVLDASIVNVALPTIGSELSFSDDSLSWVINAYVLTFGGFLLLGGRLADLLGRRRIFMVGLMLFSAACLVAGFAQSDAVLVTARAVQGLGAAMLSPAALSIITTTFSDGAERNKALGAWGAVAGSGGAAGVLLGGVLTEYAGWEWVFWALVPVPLIVAFLSPRLVLESRDESVNRTFDIPGALTVTAGLSVLVYALVETPDVGWGSGQTLGLLALSLGLLASFVAVESRSGKPLVPFSIFRLRTLTGANVTGVLTGASLFSMFFFISLYMQNVLGFSAIKTGLAYVPLSVAIILSAGIASVLVTRVGFKPVLAAGFVFVAGGLFWFSQISVDGSFVADVLGPSLLAAVGLGFSFVPQTIAAVIGVRDDDAGLASGLINTSQQVGGALGLAILSSIAFSRIGELATEGTTGPAALAEGYSDAFLVGSLIALLGLVATLALIRGADSKAHTEIGDGRPGEAAPMTDQGV